MSSLRSSSNASTLRLLLVRRQALDLRERVAIKPVRVAEPLCQALQPRRSRVFGERWLLRGWNRVAAASFMHCGVARTPPVIVTLASPAIPEPGAGRSV